MIDQGTCPNCGQKVDVTFQNEFIEKNNLEYNRLVTNGIANKTRIAKADEAIQKLEEKIRGFEELREKENKKNRLKPTLMALKENIDKLKLEKEICEKTKSDIEANRDNIKYNNEIDNQVRIIDVTINETGKQRDTVSREIIGLENEIKYNTEKIKERREIIQKIEKEDTIIRNWNLYQEMVGKNGVVKVVLKQALPVLNNEITRTLDGICDFDVKLEINEKNEVEINLMRDGAKMAIEKCASGFETTFAGLAVRNALARICTIARPSCIVLDEVDAATNPENYEKLYELYKRLTSAYDFILHIAHTEELEPYHDTVVTITKQNNISKISLA